MSNKTPFICQRCGTCCHYVFNGILKKCRFLIRIGTTAGKRRPVYSCRIYRQIERVGTEIDLGIYCSEDSDKWLNKCPKRS